MDKGQIILPWPVLYETLNTRFVGVPEAVGWLDRLVQLPTTELLDDSPYRVQCLDNVLTPAQPRRRLSLVDTILRSIIEDADVRVAGILTFNPGDFVDACRQHRAEMH